MKFTMMLAFAGVGVAFLVVFALLSALGLSKGEAGTCSIAMIGTLPTVHGWVEKNRILRTSPQQMLRVVPLANYSWPWARMWVYGVCVLLATMQIGSAVPVIVALRSKHAVDGASLFGIYLVMLTASFLVGRWAGVRVRSKGVLTVILIGLTTRVLGTAFDFAIPSADFVTIMGARKTFRFAAIQVLSGAVQFSLVALLGYWFGRRHQLGAYLSYLLRSVPPESRSALVELAASEAQKTREEMAAAGVKLPQPAIP